MKLCCTTIHGKAVGRTGTREVMVPLDVVFLDRNFVIVDIVSTLVELVGTPDSELHVYRPSAPAMYVFQIKGGLSDASSNFVGD